MAERSSGSRFETLSAVAHALGDLLLALAAVLGVPLLVGLLAGEGTDVVGWFGLPILVAFVLGLGLKVPSRRGRIGEVRAMLVCALAWVLISAVGSLPFVLSVGTPWLDAFFETVSGFTTTGITLLSDLSSLPTSLLFWRSLTQWFGGLGILSFFMVVTGEVTPSLVGAEAHKIAAERLHAGVFHTLRALWLVYGGLTVFVAGGMLVGGASPFDAIVHAFTTVSTGGFSTHDASIAHFHADIFSSRVVDWVVIAGMLGGGTSFLVHYRTLRGEPSAWWRSAEMRAWLGILLGALAFVTIDQAVGGRGAFASGLDAAAVEETIRTNLFQVLAIATTTGFATEDIAGSAYGPASQILFVGLMIVGGCVGSTGGGFKVLRAVVLAKLFDRIVRRLYRPRRAIHDVVLDGRIMPSDEVQRVAGLGAAWLGLLVLGGILTALLTEHGAFASLSGMSSALNNIGPCYIPASEMAELPATIKVLYVFAMLVGRLEILPFALLFSRRAWSR